MVWNAGDGPWWAATAEIFKKQGFVLSCLTANPTRPDVFVASKLNNDDLTSGFQTLRLSLFKTSIINCSSQKSALQSMHPAQSLGFFCSSPAKRGSKTGPSPKCLQYYCKHPCHVDGTGEELLEIHFLTGISTLPTWAPPATN